MYYTLLTTFQVSYEDVREIDELDKIWHTRSLSKLDKYVFVPFLVSIVVMMFLCLLGLIVIFVLSLIHTIYAFSTGRDPVALVALIGTGFAVPFISFLLWPLWGLVKKNREDLRSLIRFKTSFELDFSVYNYSIIEGLTRTLGGKGKFGGWKYEMDNLNNAQLDLVQAYLTKRYRRHVSVSECSQFFSMGLLFIQRRRSVSKAIRCFFVILDEKRGEVLFYIDDQDEWPYLREALEKGGFLISEVNETIVDMKQYVINDDGTIERKRDKDVELLIQ